MIALRPTGMGRHFGMRVGKRVGGVRVSAGRGGVRVGSGKQYGHARVGVSYSSCGGLGGGASYGTNAARIGTNGKRLSAGVTAKAGVFSFGGGVGIPIVHGVKAPPGFLWFPNPKANIGYDLHSIQSQQQPEVDRTQEVTGMVADSMRPWTFKLARRLAGRAQR